MLDLLGRGEKPLSILGFLSAHCRKTLKILNLLKGRESDTEISKALRLPRFVIKSYTKYARQINENNYRAALICCQKADQKLKSSPISAEIILGQVLNIICAAPR